MRLLTSLLSLFFFASFAACSGAQTPATGSASTDTSASSATSADTAASADTPAAPGADASALLADGRMATPDLLIGGQPTREQMDALHGKGFTTMITLQTYAEERVPETLADGRATFGDDAVVHLPVQGQPGVTLENAARLAEALTAAKARGGKVLLHCRSGVRAAALYGLARHQDGVPAEEALKEAEAAGMSSESMRDHLIELMGISGS